MQPRAHRVKVVLAYRMLFHVNMAFCECHAFGLKLLPLDAASAQMIKLLDGEAATMMLKDEFRDASSISSWASVNVLICKMTGIMNGDDAGTFRPQATLSRAECAQTFLNLYTIGTEG